MLIFLLLVAATVFAFALVMVLNRYDCWKLNKQGLLYILLDCISDIDGLLGVLRDTLLAVTAICAICIVIGKATTDDVIADNIERRAVIVARIESGYCGYGRCVIDEVAAFNNNIRKTKRYFESPWTSWFTVDGYRGIEPIDMQLAIDSDHNGHYMNQGTTDSD